MKHGVGSPGPPSLRDFLCLFRTNAPERIPNGDVFLWKCVGPAERPHGYVVRGPRANPRQFCEPFDGRAWVVMNGGIERQLARDMSFCQGDDALAAPADDAELRDIAYARLCKLRG
jgi:hypothetical protein